MASHVIASFLEESLDRKTFFSLRIVKIPQLCKLSRSAFVHLMHRALHCYDFIHSFIDPIATCTISETSQRRASLSPSLEPSNRICRVALRL